MLLCQIKSAPLTTVVSDLGKGSRKTKNKTALGKKETCAVKVKGFHNPLYNYAILAPSTGMLMEKTPHKVTKRQVQLCCNLFFWQYSATITP